MTAIEWTDKTWNPTRGCRKISAGCKNCYAETLATGRLSKMLDDYAINGFEPRTAPDKMPEPLKWRKPQRVFVNSMSDLFHEAFSFDYIAQVYAIMALCRHHTFQMLTKRPERMLEFMELGKGPSLVTEALEALASGSLRVADTARLREQMSAVGNDPPGAIRGFESSSRVCINWPLPNVWLGVSAEDQKTADARIPPLLQCPAAIRFVSLEPLLGPISLRMLHHDGLTNIDALSGSHGVTIPMQGRCESLDWVIVGGESGDGARPMSPTWVRTLRDQCAETRTPFFFKQWGAWCPEAYDELRWIGAPEPELDEWQYWTTVCRKKRERTARRLDGVKYVTMKRAGKKKSGRLLDGTEHSSYPQQSSRTA